MWGQEPYKIGRTFQLNDRRAVLVGVCKVAPPFFSDPIIYARYSQAARYVPRERNLMNYILVKPKEGVDHVELCRRIEQQTGRLALTRREFFWKTVSYFLGSTGIPVNFGITIALGFIVGAAVTGQTLYLFIVESLKQFGALKAMGIPNRGILRMIVLQARARGGHRLRLGRRADRHLLHYHRQHHASGWFAHDLGGLARNGRSGGRDRGRHEHHQCAARADARTGRSSFEDESDSRGVASNDCDSGTVELRPVPLPPCFRRQCTGARRRFPAAGVTKEFGVSDTKTLALRGVDLDVYDGQLTLLVGPSGCGKTTLISIIAGLLNPTQGNVAVFGTDLSSCRAASSWSSAREHRLCLSAVQPAAGAVGRGKRGRAADHHRLVAGQGDRQGPRDVGDGWIGTPGRQLSVAIVGRRAAAGGDRASLDQ